VSLERSVKSAVGRVVPADMRKHVRYWLASAQGAMGRDYFPAHNDLDRKLLKYFGAQRGGVFIEAGANDGLSQSNTWHLEKRLGWSGLLVEPIPHVARLCRQFREAAVESCALGSVEQDGHDIVLHFGSLMTAAEGADVAHMDGGDVVSHAAAGASWTGEKAYSFTAPVRTISGLLDQHGITQVDLFSLDVEGFEIHVLNGVDFDRHRIDHLLIETSNLSAVCSTLGERYEMIEQMSDHDYFFRRRS
jgi:FkbM family methyltransferase